MPPKCLGMRPPNLPSPQASPGGDTVCLSAPRAPATHPRSRAFTSSFQTRVVLGGEVLAHPRGAGVPRPPGAGLALLLGVVRMGSSGPPKPLLFCGLRREGRGRIYPSAGSRGLRRKQPKTQGLDRGAEWRGEGPAASDTRAQTHDGEAAWSGETELVLRGVGALDLRFPRGCSCCGTQAWGGGAEVGERPWSPGGATGCVCPQTVGCPGPWPQTLDREAEGSWSVCEQRDLRAQSPAERGWFTRRGVRASRPVRLRERRGAEMSLPGPAWGGRWAWHPAGEAELEGTARWGSETEGSCPGTPAARG